MCIRDRVDASKLTTEMFKITGYNSDASGLVKGCLLYTSRYLNFYNLRVSYNKIISS